MDLGHIIPVLHIVTGRDKYAPRLNPLVDGAGIHGIAGSPAQITVTLERNDRRFGQDYGDGPNVTYGKRAGTILGEPVDIWILNPMSQDTFYFVTKPDAGDGDAAVVDGAAS